MPDFLLELLSEEIPARMQPKACQDLARLFAEQIAAAGLGAEGIETYATPRRLALIARSLPGETAPVREETKGPRSSAPPQALEGFLRKTGLRRDQLVDRDGVLFAVVEKPGRSTASVLAEAVPAIIRAFPWPKSMRWGEASASTESIRWVRPLQGIVALLGEEIVDIEIAGVKCGAATVGHRFHHPGIITIGSANDYAEKLRACHVVIDPAERRRIIADGAAAAARDAGLTLVEDEGLLQENAGLTEWPVPLLGDFDPAFLDVPREVIQLTMRTNQKYFACTDAAGNLAPNFICTANIDAADGGAAIVQGNRKVLAARLSDAKFFWEQDLKVPLEEQARKLDQIVFHERLGTVADKVDRVARLARWLVEQGIVKGADADLAETAARLSKADLVTGMVGEFPELQGIIGGYLARAQGQPKEVGDAIRDHYKPVGQGDEVPTAPVTVAVSLADKLDTLAGFFDQKLGPTGSRDPFALRRAGIAVLRIITTLNLRFSMLRVLGRAKDCAIEASQAAEERRARAATGAFISSPRLGVVSKRAGFYEPQDHLVWQLLDFFADRLKVQQRDAGVRHDLIEAVFALGGEDDLIRLLARVRALQAFVETSEGADLLAGYKRAANILRAEEAKDGHAAKPVVREIVYHTTEPAEDRLLKVLDVAGLRAKAAIDREAFGDAMGELANLREPIDHFFDQVLVNDPDSNTRTARLGMLARFRDAVHQVADFSRIEG